MSKLLLFITPVILAVGVFGVFVFFISKTTVYKGALQVTSLPTKSAVFLNGRKIGETPFGKRDQYDTFPAGQYTLTIVPQDSSLQTYEEKIAINPSVLTVVDRTFGDIGKSSGSILTLTPIDQKIAQLFIASFPDNSDVTLDSNPVGKTPLTITVTESDHDIVLSRDGYKDKTVHLHAVTGYKLSTVITLATDDIASASQANASSSAETAPSTPSAGLKGQQVVILATPTGFLRVRDTPTLNGAEIAQVHPGDTFSFIGESSGWLQIKLNDGKLGWVSTQYAQKQ